MSTSKPGLDQYSAGVPLAVLLIILLDVFNIFPVIYSPTWTLPIVFIIIVAFVRTQDPRSILRRAFSRLKAKLATRRAPLRQFGISASGFALCVFLYLPSQRAALRGFKNLLLAWKPLSYLQGCVKEAQRAGLSNAAFQASDILLSVANSKPDNAQGISSIQTVIETWKDICSAYLKSDEGVLANETLKNFCRFLHLLVERNEPDLWLTLKGILDYFHLITPQLIAHEDASINIFAPYNLSVEWSIGHLVARTQSLILQEGEW